MPVVRETDRKLLFMDTPTLTLSLFDTFVLMFDVNRAHIHVHMCSDS